MRMESIRRLHELSDLRQAAFDSAVEIKEAHPDNFRELPAWRQAIGDQQKAEAEIREIIGAQRGSHNA